MKYIIATATLLLGLTFTAHSQEVPQKVSDSFSKKYPDAKSVKWEEESKNEWEVEFTLNSKKYTADFTDDGKWIETEQRILPNDLPKHIKSVIVTDYNGYKIDHAEIIENIDFKGYEVEIENSSRTINLFFDGTGKLIKKEVEEEDSDDAED
jgi:protoheme ferro-lyase